MHDKPLLRLRRKNRIVQLENDAARARAERDAIRARLEYLEIVCREAGTLLESAAGDAVPGVPPALIAATRAPRPGGEPVKLTFGTDKAIAVIGPGGDPATWMAAVSELMCFHAPRQVTGFTRCELPEGLLAVTVVPATGGLTIRVSSDLTATEARRAIAIAIQGARRAGWEDYRSGMISAVAILAVGAVLEAPVKAATAVAGIAAAAAATAIIAAPPGILPSGGQDPSSPWQVGAGPSGQIHRPAYQTPGGTPGHNTATGHLAAAAATRAPATPHRSQSPVPPPETSPAEPLVPSILPSPVVSAVPSLPAVVSTVASSLPAALPSVIPSPVASLVCVTVLGQKVCV